MGDVSLALGRLLRWSPAASWRPGWTWQPMWVVSKSNTTWVVGLQGQEDWAWGTEAVGRWKACINSGG